MWVIFLFQHQNELCQRPPLLTHWWAAHEQRRHWGLQLLVPGQSHQGPLMDSLQRVRHSIIDTSVIAMHLIVMWIFLPGLSISRQNWPPLWGATARARRWRSTLTMCSTQQSTSCTSGERYPIWFNSIFEFCQKMIHSIFHSILLYATFNSKYCSIQNKLQRFNSKDYSIH